MAEQFKDSELTIAGEGKIAVRPSAAQRLPVRMIPTTVVFMVDENGRPVAMVTSSSDGDYDHVAVLSSFLALCKEPKSFPVVRSIANGKEK
jgi:hypothetical protein